MFKDIIISILVAELIMQHPWYAELALSDHIAAVVGTATVVFIFLLFLEVLGDKYRSYRYRKRKLRKILRKLQEGEDGHEREIQGNL